ncbi:MAG: hypothetical protein WCF67_10385, partial [Chitinophagaceae bacterium]
MTASFSYKFIFSLAVTVISQIAATAQLPDYQLNRIQEEEGLQTADVINIARDKKGFMWLATQSSVQQFDGRHTLHFSFNESVNKVFIDMHDRKWAITRGGVFLFIDSLRGFK